MSANLVVLDVEDAEDSSGQIIANRSSMLSPTEDDVSNLQSVKMNC